MPEDQEPIEQPIEQQPIEQQLEQQAGEVQTVVLSDEQFSQLITHSEAIQQNQVWIIGFLAFLIAGIAIQTFFSGWRSTK